MILVTGGTGLVGSHLLLELRDSQEKIRAIYRDPEKRQETKRTFSYSLPEAESQSLFERIEWKQADITDIPALETAFEGVTRVYHAAALVSLDPSREGQMRKYNIEGTANIVNCCIAHGVEKLCFVSSIATLDSDLGKTISETSYWNKEKDHSAYAISKYGAETEVWRGGQEGLEVVIVHPGVIIGPGSWDRGTGLIFKKISNGLSWYVPKITGFVGAVDVARIMRLVMDAPIRNENFVLVAESLSLKNIFEKVAAPLGRKAPTHRVRPWMLLTAWALERMFGLVLNREQRLNRRSWKSLYGTEVYSSEKLSGVLAYRFTPIGEVIRFTAECFRSDFNGSYPAGRKPSD